MIGIIVLVVSTVPAAEAESVATMRSEAVAKTPARKDFIRYTRTGFAH